MIDVTQIWTFSDLFVPLCHTLVPYALCPGVKKSLTPFPFPPFRSFMDVP